MISLLHMANMRTRMASSVMLTLHLRMIFTDLRKILSMSALYVCLSTIILTASPNYWNYLCSWQRTLHQSQITHERSLGLYSNHHNRLQYPLFMCIELMYHLYWFNYTDSDGERPGWSREGSDKEGGDEDEAGPSWHISGKIRWCYEKRRWRRCGASGPCVQFLEIEAAAIQSMKWGYRQNIPPKPPIIGKR